MLARIGSRTPLLLLYFAALHSFFFRMLLIADFLIV